MKLNLFKRSMIFATFFGASLCVALLVASLGTKHWIDANAKRTPNPTESEGRVSFGLFEGFKYLNFGYGGRNHEFSVKSTTEYPARKWAWLGCTVFASGALLTSTAAAVLAVVNTAARPNSKAANLPGLYISNGLTLFLSFGAVCVWLTEFYLRLQYNVMSKDDLAKMWTSDGMAELGFSFWLIVATSVTSIVNILCIVVASLDDREIDTITPMVEEKANGAIMLY